MDLTLLVGMLVFVIVACVIVWAAREILAAFKIGDPLARVFLVLLVLVMVVVFLRQYGGLIR